MSKTGIQGFKKNRFVFHFLPHLRIIAKSFVIAFVVGVFTLPLASFLLDALAHVLASAVYFNGDFLFGSSKPNSLSHSLVGSSSSDQFDKFVEVLTQKESLLIGLGSASIVVLLCFLFNLAPYIAGKEYKNTCFPVPNDEETSKALHVSHPSFRCSKCCAVWVGSIGVCPSCKRFIEEEE